jgi:hypothetical protein
MMDIINPWGALRRANTRIAELEADAIIWRSELDGMNILHQWNTNKIKRLEALVAKGHFRNPKTGCIGPKGKTYDV